MSEYEELNTLKEKLDELKQTVAEMTDTISSIGKDRADDTKHSKI